MRGRRGRAEAMCVVALGCALLSAGRGTVAASAAPAPSLPAPSENFLGLGYTQGGCIFPKPAGGEPAGCVLTGVPPDPVGAAGPDNYVELVNGGIGIFDKSGNLVQTPVLLNTIWAGYPTTDGNACATGNWGDPIVRYDQFANRWLVSEFDTTNYVNSGSGPSFECVAVSKTGDPTGSWNLYDFKYNAPINDYPKFGVWPDAYYVTYNEYNSTGFLDSRVCALDRTAMLAGDPATQVCRTSSAPNLLPANVDGSVPPPSGSPDYVATLGTNKIELFKFHVDFATPDNSTLTGPTNLTTTSFTGACNNGYNNCIPQPSPGNKLDSLGDRPMDRLVYRNFGDHESLLLTHSVTAGTVASGVRWYEVRDPGGTPSIYQQGTYSPDSSSRWMGSIAEDQAGDIALGYSLSSSTINPSIAYTGRLAGDPLGTMPQGEGTIATGAGVETGTFSDGSTANRWGDYSSMTVDPSDDCTFWYVNEVYAANSAQEWDTRIASFKFPGCAANDFSAGGGSVRVAPSGQGSTTIQTSVTQGSAETVGLYVQDLPEGVTGGFNPASVTAGGSSTLTLTASAGAALGTYTATVIARSPSAVHATTITVDVTTDKLLTVTPAGSGSGTVDSAPAGIDCGATCTHLFSDGTPVTLTATPSAGSTFTGWSGDCTGSSTCPLTMDTDHAVTATFEPDKTLTVAKTGRGSGTVTSDTGGIDCGVTCMHAFAYGTSVTLTATPSAGSVFAGWSGACNGTGPCELAMNQDSTATAAFNPAPRCVVPNVKGKTLSAAKRALTKAHCALGKVKKVVSRRKKGTVISQRPVPRKRLPAGAKVNVVLSKGR